MVTGSHISNVVVVCLTTRQGASNYKCIIKVLCEESLQPEIMTTVITKSHNLSYIGI